MRARFFCENCGKEVRGGATICPSCGRLFTAVRCPQCGYEGNDSEFSSGCPVCGYREQGQAPVSIATPRSRRRTLLSARFYKAAGAVLIGIVIVLIALLFLKA